MQNIINPSVYPGEYVPLFKDYDYNTLRKCMSENKQRIDVNIKELEDSYKIELAIPGAKRENLLLTSLGNVISLSVFQNNSEYKKQKKIPFRKLDATCCNHQIVLPKNAEPVFVSAEYKAGILRLYVPKSANPLKWIHTKIAIY